MYIRMLCTLLHFNFFPSIHWPVSLKFIAFPPWQEEDLDCQMGVIDFSLYLRRGPACSPGGLGGGAEAPNGGSVPPSVSASDQDNLTTVLDQKNYIEELNRHLK